MQRGGESKIAGKQPPEPTVDSASNPDALLRGGIIETLDKNIDEQIAFDAFPIQKRVSDIQTEEMSSNCPLIDDPFPRRIGKTELHGGEMDVFIKGRGIDSPRLHRRFEQIIDEEVKTALDPGQRRSVDHHVQSGFGGQQSDGAIDISVDERSITERLPKELAVAEVDRIVGISELKGLNESAVVPEELKSILQR